MLTARVDNFAPGLNYGYPATNPFFGDTGKKQEIWKRLSPRTAAEAEPEVQQGATGAEAS